MFLKVPGEKLRVEHRREYKLWVAMREQPEVNNSIKMEVGIEDCLHIEFEYSKAKYHLRDAIIRKIFFLVSED